MPAIMDTSHIPHPTGLPFCFFEKKLNFNLEALSEYLIDQYKAIADCKQINITPLNSADQWLNTGSISSIKWREYNIFQYYNLDIYDLYRSISLLTKQACTYHGLSFEEQRFMIQGWFNINSMPNGSFDWHNHGGPWPPFFEGYYCVKAEPSQTEYLVNGKKIVVNNMDNKAVLCEMGHQHRVNGWDWEGLRITIAYDIVPLSMLKKINAVQQHWIPLV